MKSIIVALVAVLVVSSMSSASAAQLSWDARTLETAMAPKFTFQRTITIDYSEGGFIADQLRGKSESVQFSLDNSSQDIALLIEQLNKKLEQAGSMARISDLMLDYSAELTGYDSYASIEYDVVLVPTLEQFSAPTSLDAVVLDMSWRGMKAEAPIMIDNYDVISPMSFIENKVPQIYSQLVDTEAESLLSHTMIDASEVQKLGINEWHSLFDPTAIIPGAKPYGFVGEVVTTFSMGTSDIFNPTREKIQQVTLELDKKYVIATFEAADSAVLFVPGYAHPGVFSGYEIIQSSSKASDSEIVSDPDIFPILVMYGLAGTAAAGAAGFFWWSSKKAKKDTALGQTGIDPSNLRCVETSSASGGYKTNRGEAELASESDYAKTKNVSSKGTLPKGWN
jgi:hypothetical protein